MVKELRVHTPPCALIPDRTAAVVTPVVLFFVWMAHLCALNSVQHQSGTAGVAGSMPAFYCISIARETGMSLHPTCSEPTSNLRPACIETATNREQGVRNDYKCPSLFPIGLADVDRQPPR